MELDDLTLHDPENRTGKFILGPDGKTPVPEPDVLKWGCWIEQHDRHVAEDYVNGLRVSTIFIGLNMRHSQREALPPILFETKTFDRGGHELECRRYESWEYAEAGHRQMCRELAANA